MAKIISEAVSKHIPHYEYGYEWKDCKGAGYSFPCTPEGVIEISELHPDALITFEKCRSGEFEVIPLGVTVWYENASTHRIIECEKCRRHVELYDAFCTTCDHCGADYNGAGQRLAPRSQWGWETGETLGDIFNDYDPEALPDW